MEMQEVDLYSGDITSRSDTMHTEVKAEDEEYRPSPPLSSTPNESTTTQKVPFQMRYLQQPIPDQIAARETPRKAS